MPANADRFPWTASMVHFTHALGTAHRGELQQADDAIDSLTAIENRLRSSGETYWAEQTAIQRLGAQAWARFARHDRDSALVLMRAAALREDATEKNAVTPGPLAPARELLGDMLMASERSRDALAEYEATLTKEPNRRRAIAGALRAATAIGDRATAAKYRSALATLTSKPAH
jgi:hypothetical protein